MSLIEFASPPELNRNDFVNFIIFDPASQRVSDTDVLVQGEEVQDIFDRVLAMLVNDGSLSYQIIQNRLDRLSMMLDLVKQYDNLIMTKFLSNVWRRYSFFSNLGELFLDFSTFSSYIPEFKKTNDALFIQRLSNFDSDDDDDSSDDDDDEKDTDTDDDTPAEKVSTRAKKRASR